MRALPRRDFRILLAYRCRYSGRDDFHARQMPVGLGTIHSLLRSHGFDSRLANFSRFRWRDVEQTLRRLRPGVLGISLFTFNREAAGDRARAARAYREILSASPGSLWGHVRLGNLAEAGGDMETAASRYRSAVAAVPKYHLSHSLLGSVLRRTGREAEKEFLAALELYPRDRIARRGLGLLGRTARGRPFPGKQGSGFTAHPSPAPVLRHPIPDGQPFRGDAGARIP